jgi:hypothetical protein
MSPYSATREIISLAKNKHYDQHIFLLWILHHHSNCKDTKI